MKVKKIIIFLILLLIAYVGITYVAQTDKKNPLVALKNLVITIIKQTETKESKESRLTIPDKKLMPSSLENEDFFKGHWESDRGYFMLIQDDIVSREGPSIKANNARQGDEKALSSKLSSTYEVIPKQRRYCFIKKYTER